MRRDRKGRFSLGPKSPEALAEKALLRQVRDVLSAFGSDMSAGGASVEHGVTVTLKSFKPGLAYQIGPALEGLPCNGRTRAVETVRGHAGLFRYVVSILPARHQVTEATPAAPSVGGPREVSA